MYIYTSKNDIKSACKVHIESGQTVAIVGDASLPGNMRRWQGLTESGSISTQADWLLRFQKGTEMEVRIQEDDVRFLGPNVPLQLLLRDLAGESRREHNLLGLSPMIYGNHVEPRPGS